MKITLFISCIGMFFLSFTSCEEGKKKKTKAVKKTTVQYRINPNSTTVKWTAYKTSKKTPVVGKFTKLNIKNAQPQPSPEKVFEGLKFSIPVSSLFTDDEERDKKIIASFFHKMYDPELITGVFHLTDTTSGYIDLTMNGVTKKLPVTFSIDGQRVRVKGTMDISDWNAQSALKSLNNVCSDLHKETDGKSKTWNEVVVEAVSYLKKSL